MDTNLPKVDVEQEKAKEIVDDYAAGFKDVAFTDPESGKTGFTAMTPDGHFVVSFGFDDVHPGRPGWYYSVAAEEDYAHSASGSGMAHSAQAMHLIEKVTGGETWFSKRKAGVEEDKREKRRHEIKEDGVVSMKKAPNGDYEVISAG